MQVRAIGIKKEFGTASALAGVDLEVRSGELVALLGPSGSGKTTLLRIIAGLEVSDSGRVLFGDEDATAIPVQKRGVGFVFQNYALFRHMSVFDNIAFGLRVRGQRRPRAAIRDRVESLLRLAQLDGFEKRRPHQLSGGQRQRVALARALAVEPRLLLLDEPFGALDARVRRDLRRSLREIHDATGQTTIFVTHDQDEALELADRVAILNRGRLEQVGTPDEVYDRPASAFVVGFVGESSRLPVAVTGGAVRFGDLHLPVAQQGCPDGPAQLFVRPLDLTLTDQADALTGTVITVRRVASARLAEVRLDGPDGLMLAVDVPAGRALSRGEGVRIVATGGHLFPA